MELNIEQFNPTAAELSKIAADSAALTITDFEDAKQVKAVHDQRMILKNTRVLITKKGKELREDALKFQKAVIAKEKELIEIISPQEDRLEALENQAEEFKIRQERERKFPERLAQLVDLGCTLDDQQKEAILMMDDVAFAGLVDNTKRAIEDARLAKERAEIEAREAEVRRKEEEIKAKEDAIRIEAERKAADERRAAEMEKARIEGEARERARIEAEAAERRKAEEKAEKSKKLKAWLEEAGCTEANKGDFYIQHTDTQVVLFKRIGAFNK